MVGYGFVRSSRAAGARGAAAAQSTAVEAATMAGGPDAIPASFEARNQRLDQIYVEVETLKTRNTMLIWRIESNETSCVERQLDMPAEELQLPGPATASAVAADEPSTSSSGTDADGAASAGPLSRPSGGAACGTPTVSVLVDDVSASTFAASADAGVPSRPSGGANRLASPTSSMDGLPGAAAFQYDSRVPPLPIPERPGGASARSGPWTSAAPPLTPPSPPDSSRVRAQEEPASPSTSPSASLAPSPSASLAPSPSASLTPSDSASLAPSPSASPSAQNLAAWAGEVLQKTANGNGNGRTNGIGNPRGAAATSPSAAATATTSATASTTASSSGGSPSPSGSPGVTPRSGSVRGNGNVARLSAKFEQIFDNPIADTPPPTSSIPSPPSTSAGGAKPTETLRPSMRPTRRASGAGARAPRTYRAIAPTPTRSHPSFDVPEGALSPEDYLQDYDGRTSDGRVNPSFAPARPPSSAEEAPRRPAAAEAPADLTAGITATAVTLPAGEAAVALEAPSNVAGEITPFAVTLPVAEAPMAPGAPANVGGEVTATAVTLPSGEAPIPTDAASNLGGEITATAVTLPVVEAAADAPPQPPSAATLSAGSSGSPFADYATVAPPAAEPAQSVWYNPLSWFAKPSDGSPEKAARTNPSFDASWAVVPEGDAAAAVPPPEAMAEAAVVPSVPEQSLTPLAAAPSSSLVESLVRDAEEQAAEGGGGVGAAAADAAAAWSDALTAGPAPGDFGPVERVAELLEVATKTEEFTAPKYDPIRDVLADAAAAPSAAHKYDVLRGLLRVGKEEVTLPPEELVPEPEAVTTPVAEVAAVEEVQAEAVAAVAAVVELAAEAVAVAAVEELVAEAVAVAAVEELAAEAVAVAAVEELAAEVVAAVAAVEELAAEAVAVAVAAVEEPVAAVAAVEQVVPVEDVPVQAAAAAAVEEVAVASSPAQEQQSQQPARRVYKYDLVYDLLQSLRTSGDPAVILAASDPKYDPVWSLLNVAEPTPGSVSKYDMVGSLLKAALAASPQPSRYDPLQALLQIKPITGNHKYCLAQVLLRGGWQEPLAAGLADLPSADPLASVVGRAAADKRRSKAAAARGPRTVSKYDMVGQALQAAASLPEELSSGKWAAAQPRDPILKPRARTAAPRVRSPRTVSKYDMVGQALQAAASLPDDLSSGKWAAAQGRDLLLGTASKSLDEGGWGLLRRLRNGGTLAFKAVSAAANAVGAVGNMIAKAAGMPYEVAPGVVVTVQRPRGPSPGQLAAAAAAKFTAAFAKPARPPRGAIGSFAAAPPPSDTADDEPPYWWPATMTARAATPTVPAPETTETEPALPAAEMSAPAAEMTAPVAEMTAPAAEMAAPAPEVTAPAAAPSAAAAAAPMPPAPVEEELPTLLFQFKDRAQSPKPRNAGGEPVKVTSRRRQRGGGQRGVFVPQEPESAPEPAQAVTYQPPAQRLDRAVVPPSRQNGRRMAAAAMAAAAAPPPLPYVDSDALVAALTSTEAEGVQDFPVGAVTATSRVAEAAPAASPAAMPPSPWDERAPALRTAPRESSGPAPAPAATAAPATPRPAAAAAATTTPATASALLNPSDLLFDLLAMSTPRSGGGAPPSMEELVGRFGPGFTDVAAELVALRGDAALMAAHPALNRLVRAASAVSAGDSQGMWSRLYDMLGAVQDAELELPAFLEDCRAPYPLVQGLLTSGDVGQGISALCTLCNLVPVDSSSSATAPQPSAAARSAATVEA